MSTQSFNSLEYETAQARELAWQIVDEISTFLEAELGQLREEETPQATLRQLCLHTDLVSRGVDGLIIDENLECASILLRSAFEATSKFLRISLQHDEKSRESITSEYWGELLAISNHRFHNRAKVASDFHLRRNDEFSAQILSEAAKISGKNLSRPSKADRTRIEQGWAFVKICEWAKPELETIGLGDIFDQLMFDYGMFSHLTHADGIGLRLELDHVQRPDEEARIKAVATATKIYSSLLSCWLLQWLSVAKMQKKAPANGKTVRDQYADFVASISGAGRRFEESQKAFYSTRQEGA